MRFIWISDLNYKIRFWKMKKTAIIIRWVAAYIADMLPEYGFKLKIHLKKKSEITNYSIYLFCLFWLFFVWKMSYSHIYQVHQCYFFATDEEWIIFTIIVFLDEIFNFFFFEYPLKRRIILNAYFLFLSLLSYCSVSVIFGIST